jgi:hypothetical protein
VFQNQGVKVCDYCDERIRFNPFSRTVADEVFLYCSNDCLHKHFLLQQDMTRLQGRFPNL